MKKKLQAKKSMRKRWATTLFHQCVLRSWWVALFAILTYMVFEQGLAQKKKEIVELTHKQRELEKQKNLALARHKNLLLQLKSQSDPEWIELTLMKGLGMVPEGHVKILLPEENP